MKSKAELDAFCAQCEHRGETMCDRLYAHMLCNDRCGGLGRLPAGMADKPGRAT